MNIQEIKKQVETFEKNNQEMVLKVGEEIKKEVQKLLDREIEKSKKGYIHVGMELNLWKGNVQFKDREGEIINFHLKEETYQTFRCVFRKDFMDLVIKIVDEIIMPYYKGDRE